MKILNSFVLSIILPNLVIADDGQASVVLNKDNYREKTSKGLWFVKYYAPWCKFSKRLAPIWIKFTEAQKDLAQESDFHFGEVDCEANAALCDEFKVDGYPTLLLQNSKGTVEEYGAEQSETALGEYAKKKAQNPNSQTSETKPETPKSQDTETPNAQQVKAESPNANSDNYDYPSVTGSVRDLTDETFEKAINTKATWIMKFFMPSCPHCQIMAPIYKSLATQYKDKVNFGEVNCNKYGELCTKEGAKAVPYFKVYTQGEPGTDHLGEMTPEQLRKMVQDVTTPTFTEKKSDEIKSLKDETDPALVYLGDGKGDEAYKTKFEKKMVGLDILGPIIYTSDASLKSSLSLSKTPTLFMINKDGVFEYKHDLEVFETLKNWINIHKYSLDHQITSSTLNQALQSYIVVLKLSEDQETSDDLKSAAKKYREESDSINKTPVLFGHGSTALADNLYLLGVSKPSTFPYTVIINPDKNVYFDKGDAGEAIQLDSEHLIQTLHAVQENQIQGETLVPKTGNFFRDHFYIVIFGVLGVGVIGYILYKKRLSGFQYSKVE